MTAIGTPSASATSGYTLLVSNVEGQKQGLIFYGSTGRAAAAWGTGSSFLCVKAPTQRIAAQNTGGAAGSCNGELSVDWSAFMAGAPSALGNPRSAGQVYQAQGWFRDPPACKKSRLTDAIELTYVP